MSFDGVVAEPIVSWDLDSTNWRSVCRAQHTLQQDSYGCGVACLAMVAGVPYAEVRALCVDLGLGEKRGRKHPFATNFRDLTAVATQMGLNATMRRWNGWDALNGIGNHQSAHKGRELALDGGGADPGLRCCGSGPGTGLASVRTRAARCDVPQPSHLAAVWQLGGFSVRRCSRLARSCGFSCANDGQVGGV